MLGSKCQLTVGTLSISESLRFYSKLNFRIVAKGESPYNWCKITDDSLLILLYENGNNYLGLSYFNPSIEAPAKLVTELNIPLVQNTPKEKIFISKEDLIVTLSQSSGTEEMINVVLAAEEYLSGGKKQFPKKNDVLGTFGELGIQVTNITQSREYWEDLGFRKIYVSDQPYRRVLLTDRKFNLGMHENVQMMRQSIIYYTQDIEEVKRNLSQQNIAFEEEHFPFWNDSTPIHVSTPEQQHIYIAQI